jgi:hypothetical protein
VTAVWNFDIAYIGAGDVQWERAQEIVAELAEKDGRVGERYGAFWPFTYGMTELDQEAARADVKRMLSEIDLSADAILDVRIPA